MCHSVLSTDQQQFEKLQQKKKKPNQQLLRMEPTNIIDDSTDTFEPS